MSLINPTGTATQPVRVTILVCVDVQYWRELERPAVTLADLAERYHEEITSTEIRHQTDYEISAPYAYCPKLDWIPPLKTKGPKLPHAKCRHLEQTPAPLHRHLKFLMRPACRGGMK